MRMPSTLEEAQKQLREEHIRAERACNILAWTEKECEGAQELIGLLQQRLDQVNNRREAEEARIENIASVSWWTSYPPPEFLNVPEERSSQASSRFPSNLPHLHIPQLSRRHLFEHIRLFVVGRVGQCFAYLV